MAECIDEPNTNGPLQAHEISGVLLRAGVQRLRCPTCNRWYWPHHRDRHVLPAEAAGGR